VVAIPNSLSLCTIASEVQNEEISAASSILPTGEKYQTFLSGYSDIASFRSFSESTL
jgi:hypothetical protein